MKLSIQFFLTVLLLLNLLPSWVHGTESINTLRDLTKEWVALEESYSKEKLAWQSKKAQLDQLLQLAQSESKEIQDSIANLDEDFTVAEQKRIELNRKREELEKNANIIREFLKQVEQSIQSLQVSLPDTLKQSTAILYKKIPDDPANTSLGIAERMQTVVSILTAIQKFDKIITITEEVKELPNGTIGEITTLYLGLGAAYYVTTSGDHAGYGTPSPLGWKWTSQNELSDVILEAINTVNNNAAEARFVSLPITIEK